MICPDIRCRENVVPSCHCSASLYLRVDGQRYSTKASSSYLASPHISCVLNHNRRKQTNQPERSMVHLHRQAPSLLASAFIFTLLTFLVLHHRILSRSYEPSDSTQSFGERLANWDPRTDTHTSRTSISTPYTKTNYSRYAYVQYATNFIYLCNALMLFESLHRLGSTADRLLLYPSYMTEAIKDLEVKGAEDAGSDDGSVLRRARN